MASKIGISLLANGSRHFSSSAINNAIQNVTVVGGGLMGSGIAQVGNHCLTKNSLNFYLY